MEKTACRISSIRRTDSDPRRAFTLSEVMMGTALSSFLMLGVLSTFLMLGRMGANIRNYTEIEAKGRKALEEFSREVRMAYDVTSYSTTSVTLSIPDTTSTRNGSGTGAYSVTYAYDSTNGWFTRSGPPVDSPSGATTTSALITGVQSISGSNFFNYYRYVTSGGYAGGTSNNVLNSREIKQIEVSFQISRQNTTVNTATNKVLSARFILRNK